VLLGILGATTSKLCVSRAHRDVEVCLCLGQGGLTKVEGCFITFRRWHRVRPAVSDVI
jgi:hypothetical protein